jgi:hypothetical protein
MSQLLWQKNYSENFATTFLNGSAPALFLIDFVSLYFMKIYLCSYPQTHKSQGTDARLNYRNHRLFQQYKSIDSQL